MPPSCASVPKGASPLFSIKGEVPLMFFRACTGLSDNGLVETLNGNLHMKMFRGVLIAPSHPLKDGKAVSAIRSRLSSVLDIREMQRVLFNGWKGSLADATC